MDSKVPKLIFITSRFPFPLDKGDKLRVYFQIVDLSKKFDIHLICINEEKVKQANLERLASFCCSINCYVLPKYKRILSLISSLWKCIPLQVAYFYNKKIDKTIQLKIKEINPDYIHFHLIRTIPYAKEILDTPTTLDFMDAFAKGMEKRMLNESNPFKKFLFRYENKQLEKYEKLALKYAHSFCIISDQDRKALNNPNSKQIEIVSNGVDFSTFYPREEKKEYDLLFMGNMAYYPNIVAVTFLLQEVMPRLIKETPDVTLLIAGKGVPAAIKKYASSTIKIIENFEDISLSIAQSKIMMAPMQISIGLQNKIIQAMAMKVPCVVSSSANWSIGASPNNEIIEANLPLEYANAILNLLDNPTKREEIGNKGFEFVKEHYTWQKQNDVLTKLIKA